MAEISSAPAIGSPTALYPQPPSQGGALSDPTRAIDLMGTLMRNEQLRRELVGRQAIGKALQGAITPDGIDPQKARAGLFGNADLAASGLLPDALAHVQDLARSQFETQYAQDQAVRSVMGSLPKNASDEQLRSYSAALVRAGVPPAIAEAHRDALMRTRGTARANAIATMQGTAIGPAGTAQLVPSAPLAGGAPGSQTLGERLLTPGAQVTGQAPGEAESQLAAAQGAADLERTGQSTAQYHADLENLRQLNKDIPLAGPTAEWEKKLNQVGSRLGIGVTMTADQLKKAEEFDKIANQVSLNQSRLFHGSDAGLHTVVAANPNIGMSRYGREGVIDMLQGNQDALDRTRQLWLEARKRGAPANSYNQFVNESSKVVDPRVFQFNRMNRENQQKFLSDMDSADLPDFEAKFRDAVKRGWVKPLKSQKSSALAEPPIAGARLAADGHWYVKRPHENGDYQRVVMNA